MPRFTTSDGLSIHYEDEGSGLPILCLSGLTRNSRDFDYGAMYLTDTRLIRLDYRGRGQSDWASDYTSYNIPREGQDALELLEHLGLDKVAILGTSRGGLIAMTLAATTKHRLLGVALNDIGPELAPAGLSAIMGYLGRNPDWKTIAEAVEKRATVMAGFDNVPPARWHNEVITHYSETPDGLTINYDPKLRDAVIEATEALNGETPDLWPLFDALDSLPLAALRGANSDLLSPACFAEMQHRRPDMVAMEIPDRGHIPFLDEPESVTALRNWIEAMQ